MQLAFALHCDVWYGMYGIHNKNSNTLYVVVSAVNKLHFEDVIREQARLLLRRNRCPVGFCVVTAAEAEQYTTDRANYFKLV